MAKKTLAVLPSMFLGFPLNMMVTGTPVPVSATFEGGGDSCYSDTTVGKTYIGAQFTFEPECQDADHPAPLVYKDDRDEWVLTTPKDFKIVDASNDYDVVEDEDA